MLLASPAGDRLWGVAEWLEASPRRRVWAFGVLGMCWGIVAYVMLMLLPGVREFVALLFGRAYPVVVAILVIGFGVFLGLVFAQMRGRVER